MPATKKKTRAHRSAEDRIAALQAQIEKVKARAAQAKVRKDPSIRHISGAVRSIDKALKESEDKATRTALAEARATLAACLALNGGAATIGKVAPAPRGHRGKPDADRVLAYITKHPGSRSEEIAAELSTDGVSLRSVLHQLRDDGRISVEGKARATRYAAVD